jgi:hypothetical protein
MITYNIYGTQLHPKEHLAGRLLHIAPNNDVSFDVFISALWDFYAFQTVYGLRLELDSRSREADGRPPLYGVSVTSMETVHTGV